MVISDINTWCQIPRYLRDVDPVLFYCWSSVADGGQTVLPTHRDMDQNGAGSMLGQRRRRWPNIEPTSDPCFSEGGMITDTWFEVLYM